MATLKSASKSMSDLNLWFKVQAGEELMLGDIPSLIPLRWEYLKEDWEFIKPDLIGNLDSNDNPDFINQQILDFSSFVESQRNSPKKINPLSDSKIVDRFNGLFDIIPINSINTNNEEERLIQSEVARVQAFSKNDFLNIKKNLVDYRDRQVDVIGLNDADYDKAVGRSAIAQQIDATIVDVNKILAIQNSLKSVDFILANLFSVDLSLDPFALARANANNPDIDIAQYNSGNLVKLNYGESLQSLAYRYLGSGDKWIDIAIANGLKPPYIDEVGEQILLLSNGNGNQINVAEKDINGELNIDKFYINQPIFLQSNTQVVANQRTIINIRQIPVSGEIILELDGDNNLSDYKASEGAYVRVYKPNTINSSFYILIPSSEPLDDLRNEEVPWFLAKKSIDEQKMKVDLDIAEDGDLSFGTNGDLKLSYGIDNAIQALKLKVVTELGSLIAHPEFGLVNVLGSNNSNINQVRGLIVDSLTGQIAADDRFDRIESINVDYINGSSGVNAASAITITMVVRMAGGSTVVPISFTVNNQ